MIISRRRRRFCINSIVALLLVYYYSYIAFSNDGAASNGNNEVRLASSAVVNVTGSSYYDEQLKTKQQALPPPAAPPPAAYQVTNSFCYNCKWPGSETSCMERDVFLRKRNNMGLHEAIASARDAGCTTKSNSDYIKDAYKMMNNKTILSEFSKIYSFCGDCNWKVGTGQSCLERAVFLQKKYNVALNIGIASAMEKSSCRKSKSGHSINDTLHEYVSDDEKKYQHQSHNTSLVIVMGNLRGGEGAWETLYENVLDVNNADLALLIGEESPNSTQPKYPNNTISKRAKYIWTFREYDDWADAVDLINGSDWRQTVLPRFKRLQQFEQGAFGGFKGMGGSGAIMMMMRWFLSQRLQADSNIFKQYDRFVVTRSDHYYGCPQHFNQFDLSNNKVWVPTGEDYGGLCDRYIVVSRENILDSLNLMPTLLQKPAILEEKRKGGNWLDTILNPEHVLLKIIQTHNLNVERFDRVMYTVATEKDTTRGRNAIKIITVPGAPELYIKYEGENQLANVHCTLHEMGIRYV